MSDTKLASGFTSPLTDIQTGVAGLNHNPDPNAYGLGPVAMDALMEKRLADAGLYDPTIPKVAGSESVREAAIARLTHD